MRRGFLSFVFQLEVMRRRFDSCASVAGVGSIRVWEVRGSM